MTSSCPAKSAASSQPEAQTQALTQQANPHVTSPSSPPHLLTSDQDPDICQPMAICEEIRLTPQIQGPSLPAPPLPQAQAESLPQRKASKLGPSCFTRPLSRATIMEGSPVALEVKVTGQPEPTLTWFIDGDVSTDIPGRALVCEDGKHFLFISVESDADGGLHEAQAAKRDDSQQTAGDRWLVAKVLDTITVDWTWFGTLCVLLWLLYLMLL
ncbi:palladin-like isoform X2 [Scophthalmus maximus]|uniref:palladin-like isoform X2 n=1 Tax=Scophthalmus maximus TaxID=52904 RepID=UPI001FA83682|nr:palladin-like isoform X2 [Scophthalmus maximus]